MTCLMTHLLTFRQYSGLVSVPSDVPLPLPPFRQPLYYCGFVDSHLLCNGSHRKPLVRWKVVILFPEGHCFIHFLSLPELYALILMGHLVLLLLRGEDFPPLLTVGTKLLLCHHFQTEKQVGRVTHLVTRLDLPKVR